MCHPVWPELAEMAPLSSSARTGDTFSAGDSLRPGSCKARASSDRLLRSEHWAEASTSIALRSNVALAPRLAGLSGTAEGQLRSGDQRLPAAVHLDVLAGYHARPVGREKNDEVGHIGCLDALLQALIFEYPDIVLLELVREDPILGIRYDCTRRDGVHPHIERPKLASQRFREPVHGSLAGHIGDIAVPSPV